MTDPIAESNKIAYAYLQYLQHKKELGVDPVGIGFVFAITILSGWLAEFFWPRDRLRPTSRVGAIFGLLQAALYSGLLLYYSFQSLRGGAIFCVSRRGCGATFLDAAGTFHWGSEHFASLAQTPVSFWLSYSFVFCFTLIFVSWFFVCVRGLSKSPAAR